MYSNEPDSIYVENTNEKSGCNGLPGIDQITATLIQVKNKTFMFLGPHTYSSHMKYSSTFPAVK
jgi:hypothetical protein